MRYLIFFGMLLPMSVFGGKMPVVGSKPDLAVPEILVSHKASDDHGSTITISPSRHAQGEYELTYVLTSRGEVMKTRKLVSTAIARDLTTILTGARRSSTSRKSSEVCFSSGTWFVRIADWRQRICGDNPAEKTIQDFQAAVVAFLH